MMSRKYCNYDLLVAVAAVEAVRMRQLSQVVKLQNQSKVSMAKISGLKRQTNEMVRDALEMKTHFMLGSNAKMMKKVNYWQVQSQIKDLQRQSDIALQKYE